MARETSLEQGRAHALLFHFLQQQAGVEQLVNLVDAPVAQAVHVHVVFVLHDNHSLGTRPLLTGLTVDGVPSSRDNPQYP